MGVAQKMIDYKNEELCDKQTLAKLIYISCQNFSRINNQALQALMKFSAPQDAKKIKLQTAPLLQIYSSNAVKKRNKETDDAFPRREKAVSRPQIARGVNFLCFLTQRSYCKRRSTAMNTGQERGGISMEQALIMNAPLYDFTIKE